MGGHVAAQSADAAGSGLVRVLVRRHGRGNGGDTTYWEELGPTGQIAVIALGVALVLALGGSLALALGATGITSWVLGHGHQLADFTRDPNKTTTAYLTNTTPAGLLVDTADFALTFIPGTILGKPMTWLLHTTPGALTERLLGRVATKSGMSLVEKADSFLPGLPERAPKPLGFGSTGVSSR
jgi:hypothetical protein